MKLSIFASVSAFALAAATPAFAQSTSNVTQGSLTDNGTVVVNQGGGVGSTSDVFQDESVNSSVNVTQTDNGAGGVGARDANYSSVVQGDVGIAHSVTATVSQNHNQAGVRNDSRITQNQDFGTVADVEQTGAGNRSDVLQDHGAVNNAIVDQSGLGNTSGINQTYVVDADAQNYQQGNSNQAYISQISAYAEGDTAYNQQIGSSNYSSISQDRVPDAAPSYPIGAPSDAANDQNANVYQTGDSHISFVTQQGYSNDALVVQDGTSNESYLTQGGFANYAEVRQSNVDNLSGLSQLGSDNEARVFQTGANGSSTITQPGINNTALLSQGGNGNVSSISQAGMNSSVTVTQN